MGTEPRTDADELREIQRQLEWLADEAVNYPIECSVGDYDLLFDSRNDIQILLDHLTWEIADRRDAA